VPLQRRKNGPLSGVQPFSDCGPRRSVWSRSAPEFEGPISVRLTRRRSRGLLEPSGVTDSANCTDANAPVTPGDQAQARASSPPRAVSARDRHHASLSTAASFGVSARVRARRVTTSELSTGPCSTCCHRAGCEERPIRVGISHRSWGTRAANIRVARDALRSVRQRSERGVRTRTKATDLHFVQAR
jgi:hypothetical protein